MLKIDKLHLEHPSMGARMLRDQLGRDGLHVGRRHIRMLMLRMGIEALAPQPGTSKRAPGHKIYPYLLRSLAIVRANQVWALDTRPTSRWPGALCISSPWWMWPAAGC